MDVKWLGPYKIFKVLDGSKRRKAPGAHLKPYRRAKKVKKASSKTAVQAAVSVLMEERDVHVCPIQTNSESVSDIPIHSHSKTLHWNNTHHSNTILMPHRSMILVCHIT